jgi:hypothetical protein
LRISIAFPLGPTTRYRGPGRRAGKGHSAQAYTEQTYHGWRPGGPAASGYSRHDVAETPRPRSRYRAALAPQSPASLDRRSQPPAEAFRTETRDCRDPSLELDGARRLRAYVFHVPFVGLAVSRPTRRLQCCASVRQSDRVVGSGFQPDLLRKPSARCRTGSSSTPLPMRLLLFLQEESQTLATALTPITIIILNIHLDTPRVPHMPTFPSQASTPLS